MTNPIAKAVQCPSCGSPPGRACKALNPAKDRIVPTHAARRKAYDLLPLTRRSPSLWVPRQRC